MFQRLRNLILIALAAGIGAVIGRWAAEARARMDAGGDPMAIDVHDLQIRPQDLVPGIVAAFRVGEPPWSWLRIPAWLAAFGTNFAITAVGGDLDRLRQMAEDRAMSALGLQPDADVEVEDVADAPPAPPAPEAPFRPAEAQQPAPPPPPPAPTSTIPDEHPVWTAENAAPSTSTANGAASEAEMPGFRPLRD